MAPESTPTVSATDRLPSDLPVLYADQIMDVIYGVHTSKVVFGLEAGTAPTRAVTVVAIPTAALLNAATNIVRFLSAPEIVDETAARLGGVLTMMRDAAAPLEAKSVK